SIIIIVIIVVVIVIVLVVVVVECEVIGDLFLCETPCFAMARLLSFDILLLPSLINVPVLSPP
ncbi:hypothetical protein, partial [Staphylococcus pseudintermedius]|uniref:hypothetical protein n=1 Tax=Staphylococcus pseudintermedius TaxID=283734 RepID=UPI001C92F489